MPITSTTVVLSLVSAHCALRVDLGETSSETGGIGVRTISQSIFNINTT